MTKPIIGITTNLLYRPVGTTDGKSISYNNRDYERALAKAGAIPLLLSVSEDQSLLRSQLELCQGLLLAGGDDINPLLYGEEPHRLLGETNMETDFAHLELTKLALERKMPILGICRGMQVLNIACGGNVYQDLSAYPTEPVKHSQTAPRADACHMINTEDFSKLRDILGTGFPVNSFHHQAVRRLGTDVFSTAHSKDHMIEGIELQNYPFGVGVQWHPEIMVHRNGHMRALFKAFVEACTK